MVCVTMKKNSTLATGFNLPEFKRLHRRLPVVLCIRYIRHQVYLDFPYYNL